MAKQRIIPDGCDIAVFNHTGEMIIEYNDVSKEVAVNVLNLLQQLILNEDQRRRAKDEIDDEKVLEKLDELFDVKARKLLPKPVRVQN
jgi:hypothetical protein